MKINFKSKVLFLIIFFVCFSRQVSYAEEAKALEIHPVVNANEIVVVEEPFTVEEFARILLYMAMTDRFELDIPYENYLQTSGFFEYLIDNTVLYNLVDAYYLVDAKYPEYFELFRRFEYDTYEINSKKVVLTLKFYSNDFQNDEIVDMKYGLLEKTENTVKNLIETNELTKEMTDKEKAEVLYEWIAVNNSYDTGYEENLISYNGYGLIEYNKGVCSAYTSVYNLMLKMVGIKEVEGIVGTAGIGDDIEGHIWTRANLDGEILLIDSTWGDPVPDKKGYCDFTYFAVDEGFMANNYHYWDKEKYTKVSK